MLDELPYAQVIRELEDARAASPAELRRAVTVTVDMLDRVAPALDRFAEVWGDDHGPAEIIGSALTCQESDALAALLEILGSGDSAHALREAHAAADDEGDAHYAAPLPR